MAITVYPQPTQPVSAVALPLPSGASTSALQTQPGVDIGDVTVNNAAGAAAVNVQDGGNSLTVDGTVAATQSGTWTVQPGNTANTTAWKVDGSAVTQPVSGTFFQVTQPVSAAALPLPALAATSTKQSDGSQKTQVVDGSGNVIGATSNALDVNIKSGNPTTIAVTQATGTNLHAVIDSGSITANAGTNLNTSLLALESGGNLAVTAGSLVDIDGFVGNIQTYVAALIPAQGAASSSQLGPMVQGTVDDGSTVLADTVQPLRLNSTGRLLVASNGDDVMWFSPTVIDFVTNGDADPLFFDASW